MTEQEIEASLITSLSNLKYSYRPDINSSSALEGNFREKFNDLNRVRSA
jgi:type I restriction enzyme R subunit